MRKLCESSHPTRVFISNCSSSSKHGGFYVKNLWLVFCLALCPKIADGWITRRRQYVLISSNVFVIDLFYPQNWTLFWKKIFKQPESLSLREFLYGLNKEKAGIHIFPMWKKLFKFNIVPYIVKWQDEDWELNEGKKGE